MEQKKSLLTSPPLSLSLLLLCRSLCSSVLLPSSPPSPSSQDQAKISAFFFLRLLTLVEGDWKRERESKKISRLQIRFDNCTRPPFPPLRVVGGEACEKANGETSAFCRNCIFFFLVFCSFLDVFCVPGNKLERTNFDRVRIAYLGIWRGLRRSGKAMAVDLRLVQRY